MRIAAAAAVVVLVVTGCGGAARSHDAGAPGVPRALAQEWAAQASAIADASAAGDGCHALQLASSLRDQVIAAEGRVPAGLQKPLVAGVNALADRITCRPTVTVQAPPKPKPNPKPKPPDDHSHHGHHGHGDNQDGNG